MENAVEALKIAFAVMMFVLALTLSISSFSQARLAIDAIISMRDRENEYTYVEPTSDLTRTVGIETVVTSMYRAMEQNIEIYFKKSNGDLIPLCYETQIDVNGFKIYDNEENEYKEIESISLSNETPQYPKMYIDILLGGTSVINDSVEKYLGSENEQLKEKYIDMYTKKIQNHYPLGLYNEFKDKEFEEQFGEYYQGEGASEIKKRVITYVLKD